LTCPIVDVSLFEREEVEKERNQRRDKAKINTVAIEAKIDHEPVVNQEETLSMARVGGGREKEK
jgi:hypothetical protein